MPTFTLQALEGRVWDGLDGNVFLYPEPNVRSVINEGLRRINVLTGFNQATVPVPGFTRANQLIYQTPPGLVFPIQVWLEGRELSKAGSLAGLAQTFRSWATDNSTVLGPPQRWSPIDISSFVIHPMDGVGGGFLEVTGVAPVAPLVQQGDTVGLDDEYADILIDYGRSRIMLKEGGKPFAAASMAYQQMIKKLKTMVLFQEMAFPAYFLLKQLEPAGKELR